MERDSSQRRNQAILPEHATSEQKDILETENNVFLQLSSEKSALNLQTLKNSQYESGVLGSPTTGTGDEIDLEGSKKLPATHMKVSASSLRFPSDLRAINLSSNSLGNTALKLLAEKFDHLHNLEMLILSKNCFGTKCAVILSQNATWKSLRLLDLSYNPIGDIGIKAIAQNSALEMLSVLSLKSVELTYKGSMSLALNESWKNLQEIHLDENPLFGDQGLAILASNNFWENLRKLSILNCGVGPLGLNNFNRSKLSRIQQFFYIHDSSPAHNYLGDEGIITNSNNEVRVQRREKSDGITSNCSQSVADMDRIHHQQASLATVAERRGGGDVEENGNIKGLSNKLKQYRAKVVKDEQLERELEFFVETRGSNHQEEESFELALKLKKTLLDTETAKLAVLTGEAGIGKSFFCRYFQKLILNGWEEGTQANGEWLPIYVDLSIRADSSQLTVNEILSQELNLTEDEIKLLQEPQSNANLPNLLFILDGYDVLLDQMTSWTPSDCIKSNFYMSNNFLTKWSRAKIIVASRGERLSKVNQREFLFAPIDERKELPIPGSYLEYTIVGFSDDEITVYLRKRLFSQLFNSTSDQFDKNFEPSSFCMLSKKYKTIVLNPDCRKMMALPLLLSIAIDVLGEKIYSNKNAESAAELQTDHVQRGRLGLYESFLNLRLSLAARSSFAAAHEHQSSEKVELKSNLLKRLQSHALQLGRYTIEKTDLQQESEKLDELLISHGFIQYKEGHAFKFTHRSIHEFLIASAIINDISNQVAREFRETTENLLLNQKLLSHSSLVIQFIVEALEQTLTNKEDLLKLIRITKEYPRKSQKEVKQNSPDSEIILEEIPQAEKNPFNIAAANAMTILNLAKFDFSAMDLRNISISNAFLASGKFKGTNFTGADLSGVDFTKADLENAILTDTQLLDIEFGEFPYLKFNNVVTCFEFAPNGYILAVLAGTVITIFERDPKKQVFIRFKRMTSEQEEITVLAFSSDSTLLISYGKDKTICVWNILNGECIQRLQSPIPEDYYRLAQRNYIRICKFIENDKKILLVGADYTLMVWDIDTFNPQVIGEGKNTRVAWPEMCEVSSDGKQVLCIGADGNSVRVISSRTGICLKKYRRKLERFQQIRQGLFLPNERQVVFGADRRFLMLNDHIRGVQIKYFTSLDICFKNHDGKSYLSLDAEGLLVNDLLEPKNRKYLLKRALTQKMGKFSFAPVELNYRICPNNNLVAEFSVEDKVLKFWNIPESFCGNQMNKILQNNELNLRGVRIDCAEGLSEENFLLFQQKGSYSSFDENVMDELILGSSEKKHIKEINLSCSKLNDDGALIIGQNTRWINLEQLLLNGNCVGDAGAAVIASNSSWVNLKKLDLSGNVINDRGAIAIGSNSSWINLEELLLQSNKIQDQGGKGIGNNNSWRKLKILDLSHNHVFREGAEAISMNKVWNELEILRLAHNGCKSQGIAYLSSNSSWSHLHTLDLDGNFVAAEGAEELSKNTSWINLETLSLGSNELGEKGVINLSKNTSWVRLKTLNLGDNAIPPQGLKILTANAAWANLTSLNLESNILKAEGVKQLCQNLSLKTLQVLNLEDTSLGNDCTESLSNCKTLTSLKVLNLSRNLIGAPGARALMENETWGLLEELNLSNNLLLADGAGSLSNNMHWVNLTKLNLSRNKIGTEGIRHLSDNKAWTKLEELNLEDNFVYAEGAAWLVSNKTWTQLHTLNLSFNSILAEGVAHISKNPAWSQLRTLNISNCSIKDKGALHISQNNVWNLLETLDLTNNFIGPPGAESLSQNAAWVELKKLVLAYNPIGDQGARHLSNNKTWCDLEVLHLENASISEVGEGVLQQNTNWPKIKNICV